MAQAVRRHSEACYVISMAPRVAPLLCQAPSACLLLRMQALFDLGGNGLGSWPFQLQRLTDDGCNDGRHPWRMPQRNWRGLVCLEGDGTGTIVGVGPSGDEIFIFIILHQIFMLFVGSFWQRIILIIMIVFIRFIKGTTHRHPHGKW